MASSVVRRQPQRMTASGCPHSAAPTTVAGQPLPMFARCACGERGNGPHTADPSREGDPVSTITAAPMPALDPAPGALGTSAPASRLGRYTERATGAMREIVRITVADASTLVVDRLSGTHGDARLLGRLAADEPRENAQILCALYLADESKGRCRPVTSADLDAMPAVAPTPGAPDVCREHELRDPDGTLYRVRRIALDGHFPELRWTRSIPPDQPERFETVRLREVVARFEDYEPTRSITANALAANHSDRTLSTSCLTAELTRLDESPVVLNRRLREAIADALADGELSMSEIAMRCGRVKRDRRGRLSGETSWLARRIGRLAEGGADHPTPWVHSDTLALIARDGLGVSPSEVEL